MVDCEFDVIGILFNFYGFRVNYCKKLGGYDDMNFHVRCTNEKHDSESQEYVLKIVNKDDSLISGLIEFFAEVLQTLHSDRAPVPNPISTLQGKKVAVLTTSENRKVLLLAFIPGVALKRGSSFNPVTYLKYCQDAGDVAGRLTTSFQKIFDYPRVIHRNDLRWKLQNLHLGRSKLDVVLDAKSRDICRKVIDGFEILCSTEELQGCRKGLVHQDLSLENFVFAKNSHESFSIVGIIDFFDCSVNFYVFEIAVLIADTIYHSMFFESELEIYKIAKTTLEAYENYYVLNEFEKGILFDCILARFVALFVLAVFDANLSKETAEHMDLDVEKVEKIILKMWNDRKEKRQMFLK